MGKKHRTLLPSPLQPSDPHRNGNKYPNAYLLHQAKQSKAKQSNKKWNGVSNRKEARTLKKWHFCQLWHDCSFNSIGRPSKSGEFWLPPKIMKGIQMTSVCFCCRQQDKLRILWGIHLYNTLDLAKSVVTVTLPPQHVSAWYERGWE